MNGCKNVIRYLQRFVREKRDDQRKVELGKDMKKDKSEVGTTKAVRGKRKEIKRTVAKAKKK